MEVIIDIDVPQLAPNCRYCNPVTLPHIQYLGEFTTFVVPLQAGMLGWLAAENQLPGVDLSANFGWQ